MSNYNCNNSKSEYTVSVVLGNTESVYLPFQFYFDSYREVSIYTWNKTWIGLVEWWLWKDAFLGGWTLNIVLPSSLTLGLHIRHFFSHSLWPWNRNLESCFWWILILTWKYLNKPCIRERNRRRKLTNIYCSPLRLTDLFKVHYRCLQRKNVFVIISFGSILWKRRILILHFVKSCGLLICNCRTRSSIVYLQWCVA